MNTHTSGAADLPEALYADAVKFAKEKASISYVQRKCRCSYNDAARMLERMVSEGIIATYNGRKEPALAAGQAVAPAEAMEVDNYPSLPKSTGDVVDWGIGSSSREVDWSDDAPPAGGKSLYTADQMRAYVDADRATRPAPPAMDGGDAARLERERICAAIKAEDDYCVDHGNYMLDSDDCIKIVRGEWVRPAFAIDAAMNKGGA